MNRAITVRIGRIVLYGVRDADRRSVADAVVAELADRLRRQRTPSLVTRSVAMERLAARPVRIARASPARRVGQRIGGAVHEALGGPR